VRSFSPSTVSQELRHRSKKLNLSNEDSLSSSQVSRDRRSPEAILSSCNRRIEASYQEEDDPRKRTRPLSFRIVPKIESEPRCLYQDPRDIYTRRSHHLEEFPSVFVRFPKSRRIQILVVGEIDRFRRVVLI